jgi:hypothetical protein
MANDVAEIVREVFNLAVDRTRSLGDLAAAGAYEFVNPHITSDHFPPDSGETVGDAVLVCLGRAAKSPEVLEVLERLELRSGIMFELATFGVQHSTQQRRFSIVALGSVWRDSRSNPRVGCLGGNAEYRGFNLGMYDGRWGETCRFLAFPK